MTSPVRGLLVEMETGDGGQVEQITVETDAGERVTFAVQLIQDANAPDAAHLRLHIDSAWPVLVSFTGEGDARVAHRIDDG